MKKTKSKKDYIITFITEFTLLIAGLLVYRYANVYYGEEGFAKYALIRRTLSFIQPAILLGIGVGLPRYVSISESLKKEKDSDSYLFSSTFIIFLVLLIFSPALLIFKNEFSWLFFGEEKYAFLISPFLVLLIGICFHAIAYSYLRGRLMMLLANLLQFVNLGIVLIGSFFLSNNIVEVIYFTGFGWLLFSLVLLLPFWIKANIDYKLILLKSRELLKYGLQRVPGDFGLAALLSLPVFITTHYSDLETGGYVAFGISLLSMTGAFFAPISLILLPQTSALFINKEYDLLKKKSKKILVMTITLSIIGLFIFELLANEILTLYLKEISSELVLVCMIIITGCVGYCIYVSLRSILDACYVKAINTINILIVVLFYCACEVINYFIFGNTLVSHLIIISISFSLLGILTIIKVLKLFNKLQNEGDYD